MILLDKRQTALDMEKFKKLALLGPSVSALVHELQKERGVSAGYISSNGLKFIIRIKEQRHLADVKLMALNSTLSKFNTSDFSQSFDTKINIANSALERLAATRNKIKKLQLSTQQMTKYFVFTISKLLNIIEELAIISTESKISNTIAAYTSLLQGKERAGLERAIGTAGFSSREFNQLRYIQFINLAAEQKAFFSVFNAYATPDQRSFYNNTLKGPIVAKVDELRNVAITMHENKAHKNVNGQAWFDASTKKINLLKKVEDKISADLVTLASKIENNAWNGFMKMLAATIALLTLTGVMVMIIVRSITGPLKLMTTGMTLLARGNKEIDIKGIGRGDEIGAMAQSVKIFKDSMIKLEQSQNKLQKQTNEMFCLARDYKEQKELAEASYKSKSEFLATMSHEIRTPMTGVIGLADIIMEYPIDNEQRERIHKIKTTTLSLLTIINDILDLSKLEAGRLETEKIDFNIADVITETIDLVNISAANKGITLEYTIAADLPQMIKSDPTRIRQILLNLTGNAVKFTHEGIITVKVNRGETINHNQTLHISIIDTGIGIDEDKISYLFKEFTQADASTSRKYEGTGLGLAISKRLTELMGGEIGVKSTPGKGSTFWFTLPFLAADSNISITKKPPENIIYKARRSLKILLAEDNKLNQKIICAIVGKYGHDIDVVENGCQAVEACEKGDHDIILMDVRMPTMNGTDATRKIRQFNNKKADIPIIAVTADALSEHLEQYHKAGMNACVSKPIDKIKIIKVINEVIGEEIHVPVELNQQELQKTSQATGKTAEAKNKTTASVNDFLQQMQDIADSLDNNGDD